MTAPAKPGDATTRVATDPAPATPVANKEIPAAEVPQPIPAKPSLLSPARWIGTLPVLAVFATAVLLLLILFLSGDLILTDAVGDLSINSKFDKDKFGQTIGQLTTSLADTNIHVLLGLFLIVGFALAFNPGHVRRRFAILVAPLCIFGASAVLTVFFAIKFKLGLLEQIQFDQVHIDRLAAAFECHMYAFLVSALSCFAIVLLSLSASVDPAESHR